MGIGVLASFLAVAIARRASVTYGNGTARTYAWDAVDRLKGLKIDLAGTTGDQVIGQIDTTGSAIAYNPAAQITSLTKSNDAYAYSSGTSVTDHYTTNGLNQYTAVAGSTLEYDNRGNLTTHGSVHYTYSKLNELKSAPSVTMTYDGAGRLIQYAASSTTRFYYAGASLVRGETPRLCRGGSKSLTVPELLPPRYEYEEAASNDDVDVRLRSTKRK